MIGHHRSPLAPPCNPPMLNVAPRAIRKLAYPRTLAALAVGHSVDSTDELPSCRGASYANSVKVHPAVVHWRLVGQLPNSPRSAGCPPPL